MSKKFSKNELKKMNKKVAAGSASNPSNDLYCSPNNECETAMYKSTKTNCAVAKSKSTDGSFRAQKGSKFSKLPCKSR